MTTTQLDPIDAIGSAQLQIASASRALADERADLRTRYDDVVKKLAGYMEAHPDDTPLLIGSCPTRQDSGTSLAALASIPARIGPGCAARTFHGTQAAPAQPGDVEYLDVSFKPSSTSWVTDANVASVTKGIRRGGAQAWHEIDVKDNKTAGERDRLLPIARAFAAALKRVRPDLDRMFTVGWYCMAKSNTSTRNRLGTFTGLTPDATVLGIDFDGFKGAKLPYPDLDSILTTGELVAYLKANPNIVAVSFPEFSAHRDPVNDTDGTKRAAWLQAQIAKARTLDARLTAAVGRPIEVRTLTLFEYNFVDDPAQVNSFDKPAEVAVARAAVAAAGS